MCKILIFDFINAIKALMNIEHLKYFQEVARQKGFSNAAKSLGVQQSGISRAIKMLEEELKVELFERSTRSVRLTSAGQRLLEECHNLFHSLTTIPHIVRQENKEFEGYLQFGISDSMSQTVLPQALKVLSKMYPKVIPSIATGIGTPFFQRIENQEITFGIFFANVMRWQPLSTSLISKVPFYLAVSTAFRKDKSVLSSHIAAREFEDKREEYKTEMQLLKKFSPQSQIRFSANSFDVQKALVLKGLGISFFPEYTIRNEVKSGKLTLLNPQEPLYNDLNLITRNDKPISELVQVFVNLIKSDLE